MSFPVTKDMECKVVRSSTVTSEVMDTGQAFSGFEIIFVLPFVFFIRPISQGTALVNNTKFECAWKRIPGMFETGGKEICIY